MREHLCRLIGSLFRGYMHSSDQAARYLDAGVKLMINTSPHLICPTLLEHCATMVSDYPLSPSLVSLQKARMNKIFVPHGSLTQVDV
jgi:hypothetical protein